MTHRHLLRLRARGPLAASLCTLLALGAGLSACGAPAAHEGDAVTIGLLLPFTGSTSATANNFERAALYAADRINAHGGVRGRPVRILSRDTQSNIDFSRQSADQLIAAGVLAVIGPESAEIADAIAPTLAQHRVAFLSPLVGAANESGIDCTNPWFRLAPSARSMGESLAKVAFTEGLASTAVLYASGTYDEALGAAASSRFSTLGGRTALTLELDPGAQSYADAVRATVAADVESVILAASPRTAAHVINEFEISSPTPPRWFLSPLLKTEILVQNVVPGGLEGALGVAPKIYDVGASFPAAFQRTWQGDQPLEGAYFYYDAMILLGFALQKAAPVAGAAIDDAAYKALQAAIRAAAAPPGIAAGWDEIEASMDGLGSGSTIYYSGLTGPLLLETCGARQIGATSTWQVKSGTISTRAE